jgi:hypothetical protein
MYKFQREKNAGNNNLSVEKAVQRHSKKLHVLADNRNATTDSPLQLTTGQVLQRVDDALLQKADDLIVALNNSPTTVNVAELKATLSNLQAQYDEDDDNQYIVKWMALDGALQTNMIPMLTTLIRPLLAHISKNITAKLKADTPEWVSELPNITIAEGEGISGGLAVGQDAIFVTPATGAELIKDGTAEFAISHEIAHLISNSIGISGSKGLLRSNGALENSNVEIDSTDENRSAKLEEVRADIFGVDMLSSYLGVESSTLDPNKITGAISAPGDNEHPSTKERKEMLTFFRGIKFS